MDPDFPQSLKSLSKAPMKPGSIFYLLFSTSDLQSVMAGSCNDVQLLFSCKADELDRVAGNTNREVCILRFLRMLHGIDELLSAEDIDIEMVRPVLEIAIHHLYQRLRLLILAIPSRDHSYGIFATELSDARSPFCSAP